MSEEIKVYYDHLVRSASYHSDDICTLDINGHQFQVQMPHLLSLSSKVYSIYQTDMTTRSFSFSCEIRSNKTYELIRNLLTKGYFSFVDDDFISLDLYNAGKQLGIDELLTPYSQKLKSKELTIENAFYYFNINKYVDNGSKVMEFIALHFSQFDKNKMFSFLASQDIDVIERLLSHPQLTADSEDEFLELIINLSRRKLDNFKLLSFIFPEYCTKKSISLFCNFVDEFYTEMKESNYADILWSFSKKFFLRSYSKISENILTNDNCTFTSSSLQEKTIYINNISLTEDDEKEFYTKDIPNSWVQCDLHNISVVPTSYSIISRMHYDYDLLQSWRLEGTTEDGKVVILDEHTNDPFKQGLSRTFNIKTREKFIKFKLTQTGRSTTDYDFLFLQAFNVSGRILFR